MTIWTPVLGPDAAPRYRAIARALEDDVRTGRLQPGDRLPPQRELADQLGVTVGTVSRAYAEARKSGLVRGEVGRGTYVLDPSGREALVRTAPSAAPGLVDLSLNVPVETGSPDLPAALRALAASPDVAELLRYMGTEGRAPDREAGARVLRDHGLAVDPDDVILCAGAQHATGLAFEAALRPGDTLLAEQLTSPALASLAEARGFTLRPVAMDAEGLLPEALEAACRAWNPKALYTISTLHNPTTATLSAARREAIAEVARLHDLLLVEDDVHRLLAPEAPPPLAAYAPERTVYAASLAKCLAPGLRVGYVTAPPHLRAALVESVWRSLWMVSPVTLALATGWIEDGTFAAVGRAKRREAVARQALAAERLPAARLRGGGAAYHGWLDVGPDWTAEGFALEARTRGVAVTPSGAFFLGPGRPPAAVRISLSAARDRAELGPALDVLARLLEEPGTVRARL